MKIVLTGPKCSGKSTIGQQLANELGLHFYETDQLLEAAYEKQYGKALSCYDIHEAHGHEEFCRLEREAVNEAAKLDWCVISVGGSTLLNADSRLRLRPNSVIVLLEAPVELLWQRLTTIGKSKHLNSNSPREDFEAHIQRKLEIIKPYADIAADVSDEANSVTNVIDKLTEFMHVYSQCPNTLGNIIRVTTFGESHGPAIGAVLDGMQPGIEIDAETIQRELDRRRPGQSKVSTSRKEPDQVKILSGVFEGKTTGTPIALLINNKDQDSSKYDALREVFRPGHADYTFWKKYGIRDHKGGGRSSGRETASRVAAGAVAKDILAKEGIDIQAYSTEIAGIKATSCDLSVCESNSVRCGDSEAAKRMEAAILEARKEGDSVGGIVELRIDGVPAGLGDPIFAKLDGRLAGAMCSLGAVKGVEFGDGFAVASLKGSECNDEMKDGKFVSNHAGGILGGMSSGEPIILRIAVKPTPSILKDQQTIDIHGNNQTIKIEGRHDPCIVPRIIPVVEAMAALVLLDCLEIQTRIRAGQ